MFWICSCFFSFSSFWLRQRVSCNMIDIWRCLLIPYDDADSTLYCNSLLYSFCQWDQRLLFIRYPAGPIIPVEPQNGFYHTKCTNMEHHSLLPVPFWYTSCSILVHIVCKTILGFHWYYGTSWKCTKNDSRAALVCYGSKEMLSRKRHVSYCPPLQCRDTILSGTTISSKLPMSPICEGIKFASPMGLILIVWGECKRYLVFVFIWSRTQYGY